MCGVRLGGAGLGKARQGKEEVRVVFKTRTHGRHGANQSQRKRKEESAMKNFVFTLTGSAPLLLHHDNIGFADEMDTWKNDPANRKSSKKGDDRYPAYRWTGCLYTDKVRVVMPSDNIMSALMSAGKMVPTGHGMETFKAQTQSGMAIEGLSVPLVVNGKEIPVELVIKARNIESDFNAQQTLAAKYGVMLFVKRATIGKNKHVRVRPRFDVWSVSGALNVWDESLTADILARIFDCAGRYKGLGDWRPGGRTPGPYGTFKAEITDG